LEILILKLATGENVVGKVLTNTENTITMEFPVRAMLLPNNNGLNLALLRWDFLFEPESVAFSKNSVVAIGKVSEEIEGAYAESVVKYYDGDSENEEVSDESEETDKAFSNIKNNTIH